MLMLLHKYVYVGRRWIEGVVVCGAGGGGGGGVWWWWW